MQIGLGTQLGNTTGRSLPYLLRDLFTPDQDPAVSGAVAVGAQVTTGTRWKQSGGLLRGGTQVSSPAWGSSQRVYGPVTRAAGDLYVFDFIPQDAGANLAIGLATTSNPGTPGTDGYGLLFETGAMSVITPGKKVVIGSGLRNVRPIRYLLGILLHATGATILLGAISEDQGNGMDGPIPIHGMPSWRVLYSSTKGSTATLYPYISALGDVDTYVDGHWFRQPRGLNIPSLAGDDPLAYLADRFGRADSALTLGNGWTALNGVHGINGGRAYLVSGSGFFRAYRTITAEQAAAGYTIGVDVMWTAGTIPFLGLELAGVDATNFARFFNNGSASQLAVQSVQGASITAISQTGAGVSLVAGTTYRLECELYQSRVQMRLDGTPLNGWQLDGTGLLAQNGRRVGLYSSLPSGGTLFYDNFSVTPHSAAVPILIQSDGIPDAADAGAQLADDTFTGSGSLAAHTPDAGPAWTEAIGTWTISGGRAAVSVVGSDPNSTNAAIQNLASARVQLETTLIMPATYAGYGFIRAGHILGWSSNLQYLAIRLFRDPGQTDSDEVELLQILAGGGKIQHKVNIGNVFVAGATFRLRSQLDGRFVHVWLHDGTAWRPRISFYTSIAYTGTWHGLYGSIPDEGAMFDRHQAYALV